MSNPLRVLFWIRRRDAPRGGDIIALEHTLEALRARGVVCEISADPAHPLDAYDLVHLYNLTDANATVAYVAAAIAQNKPLVITPIYWSHAQWLTARQNATAETHPEFFPEARAQEHARTLRILEQIEEVTQAAHQVACEAAARIFLLSHGEGALLADTFHAAPEKFRVTRNGVDASFAHGDGNRFTREFGLRDFIFSAARIEERKNTLGLVRAWRDENIPLVFAGHAPEAGYLALCQQHAGPNVHFLGTLSPAQTADAYQAARVHVLAGWWEEAGLAALEAGLAGCNLVMTQNGPAREYFGDACWLCDPDDWQSIRAALHAAYDAPRQIALAPHIRETFTWDKAADGLCDAYAEIAAQPTLHAPHVQAETWQRVGVALAELAHLREAYLQTLEARARENAAWAHELEHIVAAHNAERERLRRLPLVKHVYKWIAPK